MKTSLDFEVVWAFLTLVSPFILILYNYNTNVFDNLGIFKASILGFAFVVSVVPLFILEGVIGEILQVIFSRSHYFIGGFPEFSEKITF